jgi:hypothetical protein
MERIAESGAIVETKIECDEAATTVILFKQNINEPE